jgi:hypothetical protein
LAVDAGARGTIVAQGSADDHFLKLGGAERQFGEHGVGAARQLAERALRRVEPATPSED